MTDLKPLCPVCKKIVVPNSTYKDGVNAEGRGWTRSEIPDPLSGVYIYWHRDCYLDNTSDRHLQPLSKEERAHIVAGVQSIKSGKEEGDELSSRRTLRMG